MFPLQAFLKFAHETLYLEQINRCLFWNQEIFFSVNLSSLRKKALEKITSTNRCLLKIHCKFVAKATKKTYC